MAGSDDGWKKREGKEGRVGLTRRRKCRFPLIQGTGGVPFKLAGRE